MERVAILSAVRTPIAKFLGSYAEVPAAELGTVATRSALDRAGLPADVVDELIYGCARQAGAGRTWRGRCLSALESRTSAPPSP